MLSKGNSFWNLYYKYRLWNHKYKQYNTWKTVWKFLLAAQILNLKKFHLQVKENLPHNATEIVRFLKNVQNLGFFEKMDDLYLKKKTIFFQNR